MKNQATQIGKVRGKVAKNRKVATRDRIMRISNTKIMTFPEIIGIFLRFTNSK